MPLIRSASLNLFVEIMVRVGLFSVFCYLETMSPFTRVIHAADLQSEYKYPRRESYVPASALWLIVLSVPCILSLLSWAVYNDCNDALEILLAWSLALGINGVLTDLVKLLVGRPRPDFFYRCFPDGTMTENLECNGDPMEIMEGRKSFPSGHSSLSFCSLTMCSAWACGRLRVLGPRRGSSPRCLTALAPLVVALCVALSRTCDYHHHWQDVLIGSLLGFTVAMFCYRQYYNPLSSDLAGVPYTVSNSNMTKYCNGKPDSPEKNCLHSSENTPLLVFGDTEKDIGYDSSRKQVLFPRDRKVTVVVICETNTKNSIHAGEAMGSS